MNDLTVEAVLNYYGLDTSRISVNGWRPVRCVFHPDKHASASVNLEAGAYRCHTCGARGDAIGLIMQQQHLDFRSAIAWAKDVLGTGQPKVRSTAKRTGRKTARWRERLSQ